MENVDDRRWHPVERGAVRAERQPGSLAHCFDAVDAVLALLDSARMQSCPGTKWKVLCLSPSQLREHHAHPDGYALDEVLACNEARMPATHPKNSGQCELVCDILGKGAAPLHGVWLYVVA